MNLRNAPHSHLTRTSTLALLLLIAACDTGGGGEAVGDALYAAVESVDGVYFFPPLGPDPSPAGTFDATLLDGVTVTIESEDATGRVTELGAFDAATTPRVALLAGRERYFVNLPAATYVADPAKTYRVSVKLWGTELGSSTLSAKIFEVLAWNPSLPLGVHVRIESSQVVRAIPRPTGPSRIAHCTDGVRDEDESGVDCGGSCRPCCVPSAEVCDGIDNDCDGIVDDVPSGTCAPAGAACSRVTLALTDEGYRVRLSATPACAASAELQFFARAPGAASFSPLTASFGAAAAYLWEKTKPLGAWTFRVHARGAGSGAPFEAFGEATFELRPERATDGLYFITVDHLDTPREVTREDGKVVWRWSRGNEPFGDSRPEEDASATGVAFELDLRFPGQSFDPETSLFYNLARDYDPKTGRYIESDPLGLQAGLNTYAYVGGHPLTATDPTGLSEQDVQKILGQASRHTDEMTAEGIRRPGSGSVSGALNNLSTWFQGGDDQYAGCGLQSKLLKRDLEDDLEYKRLKTDDQWTFERVLEWRPLPHYSLEGHSSNPNDPVLKLDPHGGKFFPLPR